MKTNEHKPIPSDIAEYLEYNPKTGLIVCKKVWATSRYNSVKHGDTWGSSRQTKGYLSGEFRGHRYLTHRVIWFLQTGEDPGDKTPDHINGDRADNRWTNLRLADGSRQQRNKGQLGFYWNKERRRFMAKIRIATGKQIYLGYFDCPLLARIAYHSKFTELFPDEDLPFVPRNEIKGNPLILLQT